MFDMLGSNREMMLKITTYYSHNSYCQLLRLFLKVVLKKKALFFIGFLQLGIGLFVMIVFLFLYLDMFAFRELVIISEAYLPIIYVLALFFGFICIASGFSLLNRGRQRSLK